MIDLIFSRMFLQGCLIYFLYLLAVTAIGAAFLFFGHLVDPQGFNDFFYGVIGQSASASLAEAVIVMRG